LNCPNCTREFTPNRPHQVYCCTRCRSAHHAKSAGDGGLRGAVSRWTRLKGGKVSVVVVFAPVEAENAFDLLPGTVVEFLRTRSEG